MNKQCSKNKLILLILIIFLSVTFGTTFCFAEKRIFPNYPVYFNHTGNLDRLSDKEIVVGDLLFFLSPSVEYNTPDGLAYGASEFKKGDPVGLITDPDNSSLVVSVWRMKKD